MRFSPSDRFKNGFAPSFQTALQQQQQKHFNDEICDAFRTLFYSHICIYLSNKFQSMNKYWFWITKISFIFKIAFVFFFLFLFRSFVRSLSIHPIECRIRQRFSIIVLIANKYLSSVCQMNSAKVFRGDGFYINKYATNNLYSCLFTFSFSMAHDSSNRLIYTLLVNTRKWRTSKRSIVGRFCDSKGLSYDFGGIYLWSNKIACIDIKAISIYCGTISGENVQ